ncbi:SOS response-associated peptidase [Pseudovibrio sp. SPO723]|uniref:SOS response-associated peptidase n=1 Tax=Nesiotobacter zosterae TaxID=392721 RepID=UPI0029C1F337|nr:SOS response-associated peptidase [Pseudovibrio sp. SPO723]MDX5593105.1 SOS response-associated peptidase [Pseudovibrio sp. SPO723]
MCGRYTLTASPEEVRELFSYIEQSNFPPRYNIAPTQPIALVKNEHGQRHFALARWGFVPSWVKDPASFTLLINARAETLLEKPSFKAAIKHRRCLIPANGFYEWQRAVSAKQPYYISAANNQPLAFAGLWETWSHPEGGDIDTAAMITVEANEDMAPIHHRMPALLEPHQFDAWLDTGTVMAREAVTFLKPAPKGVLSFTPVSTRVNSASHDDEGLIREVELTEPKKPEPKPAKPPRKKKTGTDDGQLDLF